MKISHLWLKKSKNHLKVSWMLFNKGYYSSIIDIIYMAMFSAVEALLLKKGIECKTHEGLIYLFKINYVDNALFSKYLFKQFCLCKELKTSYFNYANSNFSKNEVWIYLNHAIDFVDGAEEVI